MPSRALGFTLAKVLVVVAAIAILAGVALGTMGYIQKKPARSRAGVGIAALSAAPEGYRV
jgi:Tfp pilus assembly protein FimT